MTCQGFLLAFKEMATDLDRQSVCPPKDYCCHEVKEIPQQRVRFIPWSGLLEKLWLIVVHIVLLYLL